MQSLQRLIEPDGICFGCGQMNPEGINIESFPSPDGSRVFAEVMPENKFCGWPNLVYGGFLAMLVDCHSNYTAMHAHYLAEGREPGSLPKISCATGSLGVKFIKPTPLGVTLKLVARVEGEVGRKTRVVCEIYANDTLTVIGDSVFVRVNLEALTAVNARPCSA